MRLGAVEESLDNTGLTKRINQFNGVTFDSMSDDYLVESFNTLSERTGPGSSAYTWIGEWNACKDELLRRLRKAHEAEEL
jgi:hypothetical protein